MKKWLFLLTTLGSITIQADSTDKLSEILNTAQRESIEVTIEKSVNGDIVLKLRNLKDLDFTAIEKEFQNYTCADY